MRNAMESIEHYEKLSESKNRYSLFYNASARHEHHECGTNDRSVTRVLHKRNECCTHAT